MPTCAGCSQEIDVSVAYCPRCGTPNPEGPTIPTPTGGGVPPAVVPESEIRSRLQAALGRDFIVEEPIGQGGFAAVYAVQDRKLSRRIAVKVLHPELTSSASTVRRFIREAEAAASLSHPHILPIFFVGEEQGLVYFGMPLVQGETLDQFLTGEKQPPEAEVVRIGAEIADALADAHARGIVHRDVKPANVLLQGAKRRVLVTDFGIAKAAASTGEKLTGTGVVIGTPHYMSPEQAGGSGDVDHRSDIYSLGILLWQMLAGTLPFVGPDSQSILVQHLTKSPPSVRSWRRDVSPVLAQIVERCCAKRPEDRFQSAGEVAEALRTGVVGALPLQGRRWPMLGAIVAGVLAVTAVAALLVRRVNGPARTATGSVSAADSSHPISPVVAVLPFQVLTSRDTAQAARAYAQMLTDAVANKLGVRAVDWNRLLSRWTADRRSLTDLPDSSAAFAYRLGANQMVIGNYVESGSSVRLAVAVYDARTYQRLPSGASVDGPVDSLPRLFDRLAIEVGRALCLQPEFNPQNMCFDRTATPTAPVRVAFTAPPGRALPTALRFNVLVSRDGGVADTRLRDAVSLTELATAALRALQASAYQPAQKDGVRVDAWADVSVTVEEATQPAACANPQIGVRNEGGICYDIRPSPMTTPAVQSPASCSAASPARVLTQVSPEGTVELVSTQRRSGCRAFDEAALAFVRDLAFRPALRRSTPVRSWVIVPVRPLRGTSR